MSGSVEAACGLGLADGIVDSVETGMTVKVSWQHDGNPPSNEYSSGCGPRDYSHAAMVIATWPCASSTTGPTLTSRTALYVPPCAPLRHPRCVCGVRGVLGHVCGGRVSGRVLRGTEDLGTEFERRTCPKSLFQICYHYFRPDKRIIFLPSECVYVFLLMRYLFFHVRNHGVCVVVCCS